MEPFRRPNTACAVCGKTFYARPNLLEKGRAKTCSKKCAAEYYRKNGKVKYCKVCGREFYVREGLLQQETCCREHADLLKRLKTAKKKGLEAIIADGQVFLKCQVCGKWFKQETNDKGPVYRTTCSIECLNSLGWHGKNNPNYGGAITRGKKHSFKARLKISLARRGNKNWRWQGGAQRYRGEDWNFARKQALERDNYKCCECGSKQNLIVHHIVPYHISHDNGLDNLITLCRTCHIKVHNELIENKIKALAGNPCQ